MEKLTSVTYQRNYLGEYSDDYITRCILWDRKKCGLGQAFFESISTIKEKLNLIIQELNLRINRNIPYMVINCLEYVNEHTRIFVHDESTFDDNDIIVGINGQLDHFANITHIIDCFQAAGRAKMKNIDLKNIDLKIYFDSYIRDLTIIDILLDICFFNSYSFLREMSVSEKKDFSRKKFEFYSSENLQTVFADTTDKNLGYYSFAFSCHRSDIDSLEKYEYEIDLDKYIKIWDKFIKTNYPDMVHKEISVEDQIKKRKNKHMPDDYYHKFDGKKGVYYILRTEVKNISNKYKDQVLTLFGINEVSVGKLRIIEEKDFYKYVNLYEDASISVFKIVC